MSPLIFFNGLSAFESSLTWGLRRGIAPLLVGAVGLRDLTFCSPPGMSRCDAVPCADQLAGGFGVKNDLWDPCFCIWDVREKRDHRPETQAAFCATTFAVHKPPIAGLVALFAKSDHPGIISP